jgi:hypothetical protein
MAASLGSDPWERLEELRRAGERKARAIGVAYQLEHEMKIMLSKIAGDIARVHSDENLSEARLDRLARASEGFHTHVKGTSAAIEQREKAESEYWAIRSELEWDRSSIAHVNALSRLEEPA